MTDSAAGVAARTERPPVVLLAVVGFGVFVAADDLTVMSTMLRPIIGDLGLVLPDGLDDAAWLVNAYLIAFVAVMPLAGRVSDLIGRRRTFLAAYLVFLVGTILIPLSVEFESSYGWFLLGRVLTAAGGGAMVPVALAVVGDAYPVGGRSRALGTIGAVETLGWVWGPIYGALLVRFLSWHWQFWLNVPLAVVGAAAAWWALRDHDGPRRHHRIDWLGAVLLTVALVSLNLALLGSAEIQSVSGLDELGAGGGTDLRWLYLLAAAATVVLIVQQRRSTAPLLEGGFIHDRDLRLALVVNFVVGAGLVIALIDVPLFVNAVEVDLERSAVLAGWILSALTAAMAITSYLGGRLAERTRPRRPVLAGTAVAAAAFAWMGTTWDPGAPFWLFAVQLGLLGAGLGLTVAPTTSLVVDAAPPHQRGAAASLVMVVRLLGLSVGLSALTAWGLTRFDELRATVELPPLTDPGFESALRSAQQTVTAQAIAETFLAAAVVVGLGVMAAAAMRSTSGGTMPPVPEPDDHPGEHRSSAEPDESPPSPDEPGAPEVTPVGGTDHLRRRSDVLVAALALVLVGSLVLTGVALWRLAATNDELDLTRAELATARADLERVEAGAALYASQITGFQTVLAELEPQVSAGLTEAIAGLEQFGSSTLEFDVTIDERIPVTTEIVIDRELVVPIRTSIPIEETFDTTIRVATPLGFSVPVDVTVPVDIEVPVDLEVTVPVNETVPIEETFAVELAVPVSIDVGDTELGELTRSLAAALEAFLDVLTGLGE